MTDPGVVVEDVDGGKEGGFCFPCLVPWEVIVHRVVGEGRCDPSQFRRPFARLDGRLVNRFKAGNNLRGSADLFRTRARGLVGVGQERGWVPDLRARSGVLGGIRLDEQDFSEAHVRYATWGETQEEV